MKLSPKLKIEAIVVLLIVFFIVLNLTDFSKEVKNLFYLISAPIQKSFWQIGDRVADFFETITEIKNLKRENEELKFKTQELLSEIAFLKELEKENKILREALEIGLEKEFKSALAQVISKDISQDLILIDKGKKDGISNGLPVITPQKTLVGKISEVYQNFSKVMLISNKNIIFLAKILTPYHTEDFDAQSKNEIDVKVKGKGNLELYLDRVPREKEIKEGDLVVTTVLGGIFPKGLLVGEIKAVKKSDIEPFQQAEIKPAFDIKELETLFVIREW